MNTIEALKELYASKGGDISAIEHISTIPELLHEHSKLPNLGGGSNQSYQFISGQKYFALGDSIVEYQGTTAAPKTYTGTDLQGKKHNETVKGYIQDIEKKYGLICTNYGNAGHTLVQDYSALIKLDYSKVTLVTIGYGVNDARTNVPLGTEKSEDISTYAGCLNKLLQKIYADNSECRVVILSPIQRLKVSNFGIDTANASGKYLVDYVDMGAKIASRWSTRFVDMYRESGINQSNLYLYSREGVHPLNNGYKRMSAALIPVIDTLYSIKFDLFGKSDEPEPTPEPETIELKDWEVGYISASGSIVTDRATGCTSGYVPITKGTTYTVNRNSNIILTRFAFFDTEKKFVSRIIEDSTSQVAPVDGYLRLTCCTNLDDSKADKNPASENFTTMYITVVSN